MTRAVTERDFRKPEFVDAKPEEYEIRSDGAVVRKDRWEMAVHSIRAMVGPNTREFEIAEVVGRVSGLVEIHDGIMDAVGEALWSELTGPTVRDQAFLHVGLQPDVNATLITVHVEHGEKTTVLYTGLHPIGYTTGARLPLPAVVASVVTP